MRPAHMLVVILAPRGSTSDPWASVRWLASIDLRVLWASLAAAAILGLWGLWIGWRGPRSEGPEE